MSEKPEDYHIQGLIGDYEAGEDLAFLDFVKIALDSKIFLFDEGQDEDYMYLGQMVKSAKKGAVGSVMMQGIIVPKDKKREYLIAIRRGVALEIFSAIGSLFGFEVRPLSTTAKRNEQ